MEQRIGRGLGRCLNRDGQHFNKRGCTANLRSKPVPRKVPHAGLRPCPSQMLRLLGARHVAACEFNQTNGNGHGVYTEVQYPVSGPLDASQDLSWDFSQDPALQSREEFLTPVKSPELKAKYFVIVRHGHSSWNDQGRIQVGRLVRACSCSFCVWQQVLTAPWHGSSCTY